MSDHISRMDDFERLFGVELGKFQHSCPIGFDIVAFDEFIGAGERCLRDVLAERYGAEAPQLIADILAAERL